jgi:hypothetical protein
VRGAELHLEINPENGGTKSSPDWAGHMIMSKFLYQICKLELCLKWRRFGPLFFWD